MKVPVATSIGRLALAGLVAAGVLVPTTSSGAATVVGEGGAARTVDDPGIEIVRGQPASENYPFMASAGGCTGSLIKVNWVATAGHCGTPRSVRVGSIDRTSGGTVVQVVRGVRSPRNDIGLLQLATSVNYPPLPIPTESGPVGTQVRLIGWGLTCPRRGCGSRPTMALELDELIVADSRCRSISNPAVDICTDDVNSNAGGCYGDSGAPVVRKVNGAWALVGIHSRAGAGEATCALATDAHADIAAVRSWVEAQVGGLPPPLAS